MGWAVRPSGRLIGLVAGIGSLSYGMYLFHSLVIFVVPAMGGVVSSVICWVVITAAIAMPLERWIEKPCIALGRRLTRPSPKPALSHVTTGMRTSA